MSDLISRQAAIDAADRADYTGLAVEDVKKVTDEVVKELKQLPSVQPQRMRGKWVDGHRMRLDGTFYWYRMCSECDYERDDDNIDMDTNFCPNCGADMRGGQDETN